MIETFDIAGYTRISVDDELDQKNISIENLSLIHICLDEVAVIVRAAQPFRGQTVSGHHDHIGEVAQVVLAQCVSPRIHRQLQFLVPGDVGIAEQSTAVLVVIGRTGCKEAVLRKEISQHLIAEVPFTGQLEHTGRN